MTSRRDYKAEKTALGEFLSSFYIEDEDINVGKVFTYAQQIQKLAEREQVRRHYLLFCRVHLG
jgi:hypothetical protein